MGYDIIKATGTVDDEKPNAIREAAVDAGQYDLFRAAIGTVTFMNGEFFA